MRKKWIEKRERENERVINIFTCSWKGDHQGEGGRFWGE